MANVTVTGTLSPDVTGSYTQIADYNGYPAWKHESLNWWIYRYSDAGGGWWCISSFDPPSPSPNRWRRNDASAYGDYLPLASVTGTATVTLDGISEGTKTVQGAGATTLVGEVFTSGGVAYSEGVQTVTAVSATSLATETFTGHDVFDEGTFTASALAAVTLSYEALTIYDPISDLFIYRSYWGPDGRKIQSAWAKWGFDVADRIVDIGVIEIDCWCLVERSGSFAFFRLPMLSESPDDGMEYMPHLDARQLVQGTDAGGGYTQFDYGFVDTTIDTVVIGAGYSDTGEYFTDADVVRVDSQTVKILGDYTNGPCYVGRSFTMNLKFSRPFIHTDDGSAVLDGSIKLHKIRFNHHNTGQYSLVRENPGRADRITQWTPLDGSLIEAEGDSQFFIQGNSRDTTLTLTDTSPLPVNIPMAEYIVTFNPRSQ